MPNFPNGNERHLSIFKIGDRVRIKSLNNDMRRPTGFGIIDSILIVDGIREGWLIKPDGFSFCYKYYDSEIELLVDVPAFILNCSCGCWITYGKDCNKEFHSDKCDLVTGNNSF